MNSTSDHPIINATGSSPSMLRFRQHRSEADTEAALSLCALGQTSSTSTGGVDGSTHRSPRVYGDKVCYSYSPSVEGPSLAMTSLAVAVTPTSARSPEDVSIFVPELTGGSKHLAKKATSIITPQRKYMKLRDPNRDTSVSFEEMQRIMNVYGPIKAGRTRRALRDIGEEVQPESIKRKFYRWFPDFNDRFIKTADGTFTPFIGHEQELDYREAMRKWNQELLIKKRLDTRYLPPAYHTKTYFH